MRLFAETFNEQEAFKKGNKTSVNFVQDNQSISSYGVLRGYTFNLEL
jgi:dTDP-4-dehydrorhamnose 3,5-epimerase-like enzyme